MLKMYKGNSRYMLGRTLERFKQVTKESVGVVFTWDGGLTVLGCDSLKQYVSQNKDEIWQSMSYTKVSEYSLSKPAQDKEMNSLFEKDFATMNVETLKETHFLDCPLPIRFVTLFLNYFIY